MQFFICVTASCLWNKYKKVGLYTDIKFLGLEIPFFIFLLSDFSLCLLLSYHLNIVPVQNEWIINTDGVIKCMGELRNMKLTS